MIIHNLTEASFNRLSPVWFALLLGVVTYPWPKGAVVKNPAASKARAQDPQPSEPPLGQAAAGPRSANRTLSPLERNRLTEHTRQR